MKLASPKGMVSRPIIDRVKESLFSVLQKYDLIEGKRVADLFSGVGSLGLEALSRGAKAVTCIEKDPKIKAILHANIEKACFLKQAKVICADAFKIGAPTGIEMEKYSIVFVDPPYPTTNDVSSDSPLGKLLILLQQQIAENAIVVVRTHKTVEILDAYGRLKVIERRKWASMAIAILRQSQNDE